MAHVPAFYRGADGKELRSPVTGLPMDPIVIPNVLVRSLVSGYIEDKLRALAAGR
jgi:hypothetical protein